MMKRNEQVSEYILPVKIKAQKDGGYVASCPEWSDCYVQAASIDEAVLEVTAVAQALIDVYKEEGLKIPL